MAKTKAFLGTILVAVMICGLAFAGEVHFGEAQNDTATSTPVVTVASGDNGNLTLTLSVDKTVPSSGEPVNLTLTITNVTNQTINFTHTGLDFDFKVINDTNNLVYQWSNFEAIPMFVGIVPLDAGESFSANFTWLQTCNFNYQVQGEPVSPGIYKIIGLSSWVYRMQTPPIQLTILGSPTSAPNPTPNPNPTATTTVEMPAPTQSPTPTPDIPELSWLLIVPLLLFVLCVAFIFRHQKNR
jgi:hypothetical protein